jgi:general nucleoside transport system ATP-binding protein
MQVADVVTVLRRGQFVASTRREGATEVQLAEWMVGSLPIGLNKEAKNAVEPGLSVRNMNVQGDRGEAAVRDVSFEIGRGEILGFGGVDGNGQVELAEALAGIRRFEGKFEFVLPDFKRGYIPQDRQMDGLALSMTIRENLQVGRTTGFWLSSQGSWQTAQELIAKYEIKADSPAALAGSLSGGNQQKVVVARELDSGPDFLVALNPTRGLDIRSADFVHRSLLNARDQGVAIALFSTDLDELAAVASRTYMMSSGRLLEPNEAAALVGGV